MTTETAMKLIVKSEFADEMNKRRDITPNRSPVFGETSAATKATLLIVEDEIDKKFKRLINGEDIYSILPNIKHEKIYDKDDIDEDNDYKL